MVQARASRPCSSKRMLRRCVAGVARSTSSTAGTIQRSPDAAMAESHATRFHGGMSSGWYCESGSSSVSIHRPALGRTSAARPAALPCSVRGWIVMRLAEGFELGTWTLRNRTFSPGATPGAGARARASGAEPDGAAANWRTPDGCGINVHATAAPNIANAGYSNRLARDCACIDM